MSSFPSKLDFPKAEEEVCEKWKNEDTFKTQNRLSEDRGDEVRINTEEYGDIHTRTHTHLMYACMHVMYGLISIRNEIGSPRLG